MNIITPINQLGYGITGLNIVKALAQKTNVALWVIGQPQVTCSEDARIVSACIKNAHKFNPLDTCLRIWHQHDMAQFAGRGQHIGFPIFELDEFNEIEKHQLGTLENIFVCSQWAKDVILNNISISESNVHVIPLGVDRDIFRYEPSENENETTVFFTCGKWEIRKGHDVLVEIFNEAFSANDNVELWMLCNNPFLSPQEEDLWHKLYLNSKLGSKIKLVSRLDTQEQVYNIMKDTDCGLFFSRAEGWNLELLEMMSCGKSVIATNCTAHTEFCNQDNSYLINISEYEMAYDGQWFHGNCGKWATIGREQKDQAIEYMRLIHKLKQSGSLSDNLMGIHTAKQYTWENTSNEIIKHI